MAIRNFQWSSVLDCVMTETDGSGNTLVTYTHEPTTYGPLLSENRGGAESYHHIVQKVIVDCNITDCDKKEVEAARFSYWGAWRIEGGTNAVLDNMIWSPSYCTRGKYRQDGEVRFYCDDEIAGEIANWAANQWFPNADSKCKTTSIDLLATKDEPAFWKKTKGKAGSSSRSGAANWGCCPESDPCCGDGSEAALIVELRNRRGESRDR